MRVGLNGLESLKERKRLKVLLNRIRSALFVEEEICTGHYSSSVGCEDDHDDGTFTKKVGPSLTCLFGGRSCITVRTLLFKWTVIYFH